VEWIDLAQEWNKWRAVVNSVMNLRVPCNAGKLPSGCTTGGLTSSAQLHRVSYNVTKTIYADRLREAIELNVNSLTSF
jgi:hypothetical protein